MIWRAGPRYTGTRRADAGRSREALIVGGDSVKRKEEALGRYPQSALPFLAVKTIPDDAMIARACLGRRPPILQKARTVVLSARRNPVGAIR